MKPDSVLKCFLLMVAVFAVAEAGLLVREVRFAQRGVVQSVKQTIDDADATVLIIRSAAVNASMTLGRIEEASASWKDASKKQEEYFAKIAKDSAQTIGKLNTLADSLNALVQNTDVSVNRGLLPKVDMAIEETTATIKTARVAVETANEGATVALEDIHTILSDPSITEALMAIEGSAKHIEGTTASAEKSAGYIEGYLSPKKTGFWAKVIQFFIPKFSIDLR